MTGRSTDFKPAIREEIEGVSVGDRYNIWTDDGYYVTPATVVYSEGVKKGLS